MMFTLVNDNGMIVSAILWLIVLLFVLLIAVTVIKLIQLCFTCHKLMSNTIYVPVYSAYVMYKNFMQIDPCPVIDV
ncbi:envelope protein [Hipposideros pomona bat coronavirus HKU10-related]|uniref:Envelope protein n=3 Tax=unclassified Orthocoronavirinae TaxID=2730119 RepID=A0AA49EBS3_9NIDO|nr:envelope protein [Hipposideros pomona bat coronavirus HKU10-related]WCC61634.1 envelope protein [Bat Coronavirus HpGD17]WCC61666.1 envelope protein [Bat Coronavirus HpGX16]WCC61682.1 envelope protein [Bat Coronavirus HpYN20]WCZ55979.1 MAG: E [Bat coronavirus HKU10] [Bat coronavirus HKU10]